MVHKCSKCELSVIEGEKHDCPLEDATHIGYVFINGKWYIEWVLTGNIMSGKYESKTIKPIPIPSYLLSPKSEHPNKTPEDGTEPKLINYRLL